MLVQCSSVQHLRHVLIDGEVSRIHDHTSKKTGLEPTFEVRVQPEFIMDHFPECFMPHLNVRFDSIDWIRVQLIDQASESTGQQLFPNRSSFSLLLKDLAQSDVVPSVIQG